MKNTVILALVGLLAPTLLITGCDQKSDSARAKPAPLPPATVESTVRRLTTPQEDVNLHVVAAQSSFTGIVKPIYPADKTPEAADKAPTPIRPRVAPELIPKSGITINEGIVEEHDWSGIVLVPKDLSTALVFTTKVAVQYIEVHPLQNGAVRIWTRLVNRTGHAEKIEIGCAFRTHENPDSATPRFYEIELPQDYIDVFFVSPRENINAYTFLIRSAAE